MMRPPGRSARSTHYDGDGCTGEPREITLAEGYEIREAARTLLLTAEAGDWHDAVSAGDAVALHYGPRGEWFLSSLLAEYISRGAEPHQRGPGRLPQIALTVPEGDPAAPALLREMAARRRQPAAPGAHALALRDARIPLQTFVLHFHNADVFAARRVWAGVYRHDGNTPHLTALAFTAQLVMWSARCALTGAEPPHPRDRAHLN